MMVIEARDVAKYYTGGDGGRITVLDGINLDVQRGEMIAIVGASGSGKSTLLHILGALDQPSRGTVRIDGISVTRSIDASDGGAVRGTVGSVGGHGRRRRDVRSERRRDEGLSDIRNRKIGFVFQFHHLLREFSALENVMMPLRIAGRPDRDAKARAEDLLARVGLGERMAHRPSEMSGGEQQRAAVARALAIDPAVVLADEPSGNLDHMNAERLHDLFAELVRDLEIAMVVVTHNGSLAARATRTLTLEDGRFREADVGEVIAT